MLKDCDWSPDRDYKTGTENEPLQFYLDGLVNSSEFYLLLGYFSSAAINLLSAGFATFISKGGNVKMIINHILSEKDKAAFELGQNSEHQNKIFDITDIVSLTKVLDEYDQHFFECLAYLISEKRIEIKVIKPKKGNGIAHYKSGVFFDGEDYVGYKASCNFTLYGLSENLEELEAFLSWENGRSNKLIRKQVRTINSYFDESDDTVEYINADDIEVAIRDKFAKKDINELLIQESDLMKRKGELIKNKKIKKTISKIYKEIDKVANAPRFPYVEGPREYQIEAYEKWVNNNYCGIFAMATGTGKTITSLNCLLNEYLETGKYQAIITVPTTALVDQWKKECNKFNFKNIITVSSKEKWEENLSFFSVASKFIEASYIIIITYASLPRQKFRPFLNNLPKSTLLIADETHNLGSKSLLKLLPNIKFEKRIGLSATPDRKFDEEGNNAINTFFNDQPPYIVSYSMEEAMKRGWLCSYKYFPHIVKLTEDEFEKYEEITLQLIRMGMFDKETGSFKSSPEIEMKLLERKRIIHKAINKLDAFQRIVKSEFDKRGDLKYTLVYVPEGVEPNYSEIDYSVETDEENNLINEYTRAVSKVDDFVMVKQFTANTPNRAEILNDFASGKIHVLTSMKCLDEGVDVPRSELAIFCASTGNPRQFIQRRGRVLRLHDDKTFATIHDLIVVPQANSESTFEMEKALVKREMERVLDFAKLSMNKADTYEALNEVLNHYSINLYE